MPQQPSVAGLPAAGPPGPDLQRNAPQSRVTVAQGLVAAAAAAISECAIMMSEPLLRLPAGAAAPAAQGRTRTRRTARRRAGRQ